MHTCPDCLQACSCNGDIDDLWDCCEADADAYRHCLGREDEDDAWGCCYAPGECCMPGEHMMSECHTAEDAEACYEVTPNAQGERRAEGASFSGGELGGITKD